jgi:hypothetical protein
MKFSPFFAARPMSRNSGAQATNTRALALVGDADANAYELLFP